MDFRHSITVQFANSSVFRQLFVSYIRHFCEISEICTLVFEFQTSSDFRQVRILDIRISDIYCTRHFCYSNRNSSNHTCKGHLIYFVFLFFYRLVTLLYNGQQQRVTLISLKLFLKMESVLIIRMKW